MSHALVAVRRGRRHVALLRLRRPIRDKPSGYLHFAALATKPGEKSGLTGERSGLATTFRRSINFLILGDAEKAPDPDRCRGVRCCGSGNLPDPHRAEFLPSRFSRGLG